MKPLLSELFLPCSGMHSSIRANRYPLTTITGAQRASGQTHSRARSHQDGADLRADRSTAYLVSCIRVRSAHGNSLDHLVAARSRNDSGVVSLTEAFKEIAPSLPAHLADALALRLFRHAERWLQRGAKELWLDPQPVDPVIRDVPRLENQPKRVRAGLQAPAWPQGSFA